MSFNIFASNCSHLLSKLTTLLTALCDVINEFLTSDSNKQTFSPYTCYIWFVVDTQ